LSRAAAVGTQVGPGPSVIPQLAMEHYGTWIFLYDFNGLFSMDLYDLAMI
jgi:hypothetical protein